RKLLCRGSGLAALTELSEELGGSMDRRVTQAKEVLIARDQERSLADGEREEVVTSGKLSGGGLAGSSATVVWSRSQLI
ncbi:MAG: hypothetical protein M3018_03990, partial [Actinomycetota bacterium]|nr:hypothetical protein [Actinomycetota bacterium]